MKSVAHAPAAMHGLPVSDTPVLALWAPKFPSPQGLDLAAKLFDARPAWKGEEGPRPRLVISAGAFAIEAPDLARRERRYERALKSRQLDVDVAATYFARGEEPPERVPSREVTGWSRKSRAAMVRALCELDYRPMLGDPTRLPAMVTLTYPADWLTVAPNGKAAKAHLRAFRERYQRAWGTHVSCTEQGQKGHARCGAATKHWQGEPVKAVWKLEFQHRGAPHFHLLLVPPHSLARTPDARARADRNVGAGLPFRQWLSEVWADIVGADDIETVAHDKKTGEPLTARDQHRRAGTGVDYTEGLKAYDPKRTAVYFTKHGAFQAKEYQHCVPEEWREPGQGPGRFWGYWNLERVTAAVEVTPDQAVQAARIARRWAHAQRTTRQVTVTRTRGGQVHRRDADVQSVAGAQLLQGSSPSQRRKVRRRVRRFGSGRGFISVNNGQIFAVQVARALSLSAPQRGSIPAPSAQEPMAQPRHQGSSCTVCGHSLDQGLATLGRHIGCGPRWDARPQ